MAHLSDYVSGGGHAFTPVTKTEAYTASAWEEIIADTAGGAFTITLPPAPSLGNIIKFVNHTDSWETYSLTIDRNGEKMKGTTENLVVDLNASFSLIFTDSTEGWVVGG